MLRLYTTPCDVANARSFPSSLEAEARKAAEAMIRKLEDELRRRTETNGK